MITTVVGSYPPLTRDPLTLPGKIAKIVGSYDKYKPAIALAVSDQIKAGVDIISDGQVRGNMLEIFAKNIPGMEVENETPKITGKIKPSPISICQEDFKYAMKIAKQISKDYSNSKKSFEKGTKGVKGIITGPSTLVFSSRIDGFYKKKEAAIIDLAYALKKEAQHLENAGAIYIQIDEPYLSTGVVDVSTAKMAIEIIVQDLLIPVSLHVCGDLSGVFNQLITFPVDIIDCEFAGIPKNLKILEKTDLKGKKIGFGCFDTKTDHVESKEQILKLIEKGVELIGSENMIVDPDCGMRMRKRSSAFEKLKTMVEACKTFSS
ncbi:MAG: methionine synthase [Methanobacteriaceae archaeon]|nr:methionine synthase [Methanobacteriaceae archaeon]